MRVQLFWRKTKAQYEWAVKRVEQLLPLVPEEPSLIDVLKLRMYERGLTQKALAEILGLSPSRLSDLLSGKCEPTMRTARTICNKLDIDAAIVLGVKGQWWLNKLG